jgi:hypothetical protein
MRSRAAEVLQISRGSVYYLPRPVPDSDLAIMRRLDRLHLEFPLPGSRMLRGLLAAEGCKIGRRHVKTLIRWMQIGALYRRPRRKFRDFGRHAYGAAHAANIAKNACELGNELCAGSEMSVSQLSIRAMDGLHLTERRSRTRD